MRLATCACTSKHRGIIPSRKATCGVPGPHESCPPSACHSIDWETDTTDEIVRKIRAADGQPGVRDNLLGLPIFLYGASHEDMLKGRPKQVHVRSGHGHTWA